MPEYTAKRAQTRGQLLAAGQELLPGAVRRGLEHALGPGPVAQRAEVSRQTWYRYWRADDSAYLEQLLAVALDEASTRLEPHLARAATDAGTERDAETETEPFRDDDDAVEHARALTRAHFAAVTQRRVAVSHMIGATLALEDRFLANEEGVRTSSAPEILRRYHDRVESALTTAYRSLLHRWGRRPAPGSDLAHVVEVLAALADGFALRPPPEGSSGGDDGRFARAAVAVLEALTVPDPAAYRGTGWSRPENPNQVTYR